MFGLRKLQTWGGGESTTILFLRDFLAGAGNKCPRLAKGSTRSGRDGKRSPLRSALSDHTGSKQKIYAGPDGTKSIK